MFVDAFSALLIACEGRYVAGSSAARRMTVLCQEACSLRVAKALTQPSRIVSYDCCTGQV